eukprot:scaffold84674_cov31-Tisochrysis_lutea.AAC.1
MMRVGMLRFCPTRLICSVVAIFHADGRLLKCREVSRRDTLDRALVANLTIRPAGHMGTKCASNEEVGMQGWEPRKSAS